LQPAAWTKNSCFLINPLGRAISCCQQQDVNCQKQSPDFARYPGKIGDHFPRVSMEQQSRLAIPLNWRNLSEDEDLVAVRWGVCRARVRATSGRKPLPQV